MKKRIIILSSLFFLSYYDAQVGINNSNPQTSLHIDGAKDNPASGIPSVTQQANDVTRTSQGKIGVGTISPSESLDIFSGNARIRNINTNVETGGIDRNVVADANGVLKTHYAAVAPASAIMSYTTLIIVPTAGYQVRLRPPLQDLLLF